MLKASAAPLMLPTSRPVKASPGLSGFAALKSNSELRSMLPVGVTNVSVTVPGVVTPSTVTSGVAT